MGGIHESPGALRPLHDPHLPAGRVFVRPKDRTAGRACNPVRRAPHRSKRWNRPEPLRAHPLRPPIAFRGHSASDGVRAGRRSRCAASTTANSILSTHPEMLVLCPEPSQSILVQDEMRTGLLHRPQQRGTMLGRKRSGSSARQRRPRGFASHGWLTAAPIPARGVRLTHAGSPATITPAALTLCALSVRHPEHYGNTMAA
jgi:hypothetical protein